MNPNDVLAVIVSFNGRDKIRQTVSALIGQVAYIHIVDNGSADESLRILSSLEREGCVTIERLGANRGVGYALNCGVRRAQRMGCSWVLTMDQDSVVDDFLIEAYRVAVEEDPGRVCLTPRRTMSNRKKDAVGGVISYAITSGNLVRVSLFDHIGLYDEGFFIDCVDFDFCLRLRRAGHVINLVPSALLHHQVGDHSDAPAPLRKYYTQHSAVRRYYMYRNYMYLAERYLFDFPIFIAKLGFAQVILLLLIGLLDPSPLASYRAIVQGIKDYAARKDGPYLEKAR